MIRVAIIEPHRVVREGLLRVLADVAELEVVAAVDETPALDLLLEGDARPDAILLAPSSARADSELATLPALVASGIPVVALLSDPRPRDVRSAIEGGARGVLAKTAGPDELVDALRAVAAGQRAIAQELAATLGADDDPLGDLSHREREVLRLIALGHTTPEIAGLLDISTRTVESHRHHILVKLDLRTRADLVRYALQRGLIGPGG